MGRHTKPKGQVVMLNGGLSCIPVGPDKPGVMQPKRHTRLVERRYDHEKAPKLLYTTPRACSVRAVSRKGPHVPDFKAAMLLPRKGRGPWNGWHAPTTKPLPSKRPCEQYRPNAKGNRLHA